MTPSVERSFEFVRAEDAGDPHAFRSGIQEYLVRRGDGSFEAVRVRWDEELLAELVALREAGRDPELPRRLGDRLREWFAAALGLDALAAAHARGEPVRLRVISSAAELYALPWELLTLPGSGAHLGATADVEITYRWPAATCRPPDPARPEGGRILFAWSRAYGPVGERLLADAIAAAATSGHVSWDMVSDEHGDASLPGLVERLERETRAGSAPAVLHLLCHGAPTGDGYGLGLDDGRGGRVVVDSGAIARALAPFARQVRLVVLTACDSGNPGVPGTRLGSAVQELHRVGFEAVIASRLPLSGAAALEFTAELYRSLLVETCSVEHAFSSARARLLRLPGSLDWASVQLYQHALAGSDRRPIVFRPYRGLLAFEDRHARFFYGRDPERDEIIADLEALRVAGRPRFMVVAGASGTGKSSVVLAGVLPALVARGWTSAVIRPGDAPATALAQALARRSADRQFLLVVDQFEEVFTHGNPAAATAFASELWALARRDAIAVIVTIRVDFLGRCGELTLDETRTRLDQVAYDEAHRTFVARMPTPRLAEAITRPAERVGLRFEEGLCARLIRDVGDEPGALPLLQYALDALWVQRAGDVMTHATLDAIGGVGGAMTRHADAVIAGLDAAAQKQARRTLVRLVEYGADMASGTRRRVALAELRPPHAADAFEQAVAALVDARLVQLGDEGETLTISHEALIRRWPALWGWYQTDRERLARQNELRELISDARQYGVLLLGRALARARELADEFRDETWPEAWELITRSTRSATFKRWRRIVVSVLLFALTVTFAIVKTRDSYLKGLAREQLALALAQAHDRTRLSAADRLLSDEPWAAAALLREIEHTGLPRWRQLAFAVTQVPLPTAELPGVRAPGVLTADGARLVTDHEDGDLRVWSLADEEVSTLPAPLPGQLLTLALDELHEPPRLAVLRDDSLELWRLDDSPQLIDVVAGIRGAAMHHHDGRIAVADPYGTVDLWAAADGGLELVAEALPCVLMTPGALACAGEFGDELRRYADPSLATPLPRGLAQLQEQPWGGVSGLASGEHVAWNGDTFVSTGLRPPDDQGFIALDAAGPLVHGLQMVTEGEGLGALCRVNGRCAALPLDCLIAHVSRDSVTAACRDGWRIFDRASLSLRQIVRRPPWALGGLVDAAGSRMVAYLETGGAWSWRLARGTRSLGAADTLAARLVHTRVVALEMSADRSALELVDRDLDSGVVARRLPLPSDVWRDAPALVPAGEAVALVGRYAPGMLATLWIDPGPAPRLVQSILPGELGEQVFAAHPGTRRLLRAEGATVVVDAFSGPESARLGVALAAPPCTRVTALALAPDGASAAVGCAEGDVSLLELPSLRWLAYLAPPVGQSESQGVAGLAFDATGQHLAVGRVSGVIERADGVATRQLTSTALPPLHKAPVAALDWSEERLASADATGVAAIWLDPAGPAPAPLSVRADVPFAAIALRGDRLLGTTVHGGVREAHAITDIARLTALLRRRAIYCPTSAERIAWLGEPSGEAKPLAAACRAVAGIERALKRML